MSDSRDHYADSQKKPCRNCVDARTWYKMMPKKQTGNGSASSSQNSAELRKDCPLFVDELGRSSWNLLHTMAAKVPDKPNEEQQKDVKEFMRLFSLYYPCEFCAVDLQKDLQKLPPDVSSQEAFSKWMCQLHNMVNKKLGKQEFDCNLVQQRWRDGWNDGRCDQ